MKTLRAVLLISLVLLLPVLSLSADEPVDKAEIVQTSMTILGATAGLGAGAAIGLGFSLDAIDTPLSNTLRVTIPVAAAGAAAGALAGRWIADVTLRHQPSPLFSIIEGAGLGLVAGAFVGAVVFPLNFLLAYPILEVPEGYWGKFDYLPTIGMGIVAGAVWGGIFGSMAGAVTVPILSLLMGF